MRLVIDDLDDEIYGPFYIEIILSLGELERVKSGKMVNTELCVRGKRFYVGVLKEKWSKYEEESEEEDEEYKNEEGHD